MKPMIWHPEERDQHDNQYLDNVNHPPYITIYALLLGLIGLFTLVVLFAQV